MKRRIIRKIFRRAQGKIEKNEKLTTVEHKVWKKITEMNMVPFTIENKIKMTKSLINSYASDKEKFKSNFVPSDEHNLAGTIVDIEFKMRLEKMENKLLIMKTAYCLMKKNERNFHYYQFKVI